jgi:putative transcriptional regulator
MGKKISSISSNSVIYSVQPQIIRKQLSMSQSQFARAFGISLRTLQCWEQGQRNLDMTAASYLRVISKLPKEVQEALAEDNQPP